MAYKTMSNREDKRIEAREISEIPLYKSRRGDNVDRYKGLRVLEERIFLGPTSIRYWM